MRSLLLALGVALTSSSCTKETADGPDHPAAPDAAATTDALWAFAPPDLDVAVVIADGALASLQGGARRVLTDLAKAPGGPAIAARIRASAADLPVDPLDPAALSKIGIDLAKGAAVFVAPSGRVVVVPVADVRKLVARMAGSFDRLGKECREIRGRYVCAETPEALDAAAARTGRGRPSAWPAELRGHVEVFVSPGRLGDVVPLAGSGGLRAAALLERGAVTVRAHWKGSPTGPLATVRGRRSSLATEIAAKQPVGLFLVNAATVWNLVKATAMAKVADAAPLPGGVRVADLLASWSGHLVAYAPPGLPSRGLFRFALTAEEPAREAIHACTQLGALAPPGITLARKGDHCLVTADLSEMKGLPPGRVTLALDVWVEPGALMVGVGDHAARSDARPGLAPLAGELLQGDWLFAAWGRGAMVGGQLSAGLESRDRTGGLMMWALRHVNEVGVAATVADDGLHGVFRIRTLWANPDEVVASVQAAMAPSARADGAARLRRLAAEHPDSPFARDMQADEAGTSVEVIAIGLLASMNTPAARRLLGTSEGSR